MFRLEPESVELVDSEQVSRVMIGGHWHSVVQGTFEVVSPVTKQARRNPGAAQAMFFRFVREERSLHSGNVIREVISGPLHGLQAWATPDEEISEAKIPIITAEGSDTNLPSAGPL